MEIVKQNISQAKRFIRNQNYDDALVVLNKVLTFQPNRPKMAIFADFSS